jgi:hypothetical protein
MYCFFASSGYDIFDDLQSKFEYSLIMVSFSWQNWIPIIIVQNQGNALQGPFRNNSSLAPLSLLIPVLVILINTTESAIASTKWAHAQA